MHGLETNGLLPKSNILKSKTLIGFYFQVRFDQKFILLFAPKPVAAGKLFYLGFFLLIGFQNFPKIWYKDKQSLGLIILLCLLKLYLYFFTGCAAKILTLSGNSCKSFKGLIF